MTKTWGERLSYLAGFIDGEAWIGVTKKHKNCEYILSIAVANTNKDVLKCFKKYFEGSIVKQHRRKKYKIMYTWKIQARKAEYFLKEIFPYLIVKKEQAKLGLKLRDLMNSGQILSHGLSKNKDKNKAILEKRDSIYWKIRKLNGGEYSGKRL